MRTSVYGGADATSVNELVGRVQAAADAGWSRIWFSQGNGLDVHTALAAAAMRVPGIGLGSSVVPIQGRHPISLAQQALTVASAAGPGRFSVGLGVTHKAVSEGWYGVSYSDVVDLCEEHVPAFAALVRDRKADVSGRRIVARASLQLDVPAPEIFLGALAPRMLRLAGTYADGTITWMTGPRGIGEHVAPAIRQAAAEAGKAAAPQIVVGLPVCVTDQPATVRDSLRQSMSRTAGSASYGRMVALERIDNPADLAIIGSQDEVLDAVGRLASAGATELLVNAVGDADAQARTAALLAELNYA